MSLIEQIEELKNSTAEQTLASQALAQEVAGKVSEINKALSNAVAVAPNLKRRYYVDLNGSDENDGSVDTPFRTAMRAISLIPESGFGEIYLNAGSHEFTEDLRANNNITIFLFPGFGSDETNTELKFMERNITNGVAYISTLWLTGGYFYSHNIKLSTGMKSDPNTSTAPYAAIQARFGCYFSTGNGSIEVGDYHLVTNAHSWSAQADLLSVNLSYLSSIKKIGDGALCGLHGFSTVYSVACTLDGTTWDELIQGNRNQIFNNVSLT